MGPGLVRLGSVFALVTLATLAACSSKDETKPAAPASASSPPPSPGAAPTDTDPNEAWNPPTETGAVSFPYTPYRCGYAIRQVSPSPMEAVFHDAAPGAAPTPKNLHLTIAGNAASSVVVQWGTGTDTLQTEVRFGEAPEKLDRVAHGFSFAYSEERRQHEVHLCGLKPSTTYYYEAGGEAARAQVYTFTTAPADASEVKILVAGDTRSSPATFGAMAPAALALGPTAMVMSGDAVASGGFQNQWDALFEAAPELFARLPTLWAHGNHEGLSEMYFSQMALPDWGGASGVEEWYATTYGPIRWLVLNDTTAANSVITNEEKGFLSAELTALDRAKVPFVAALHHKPMYTTSDGHDSETLLRKEWGPLFAQHRVQLDVAGHVHSYESTKPIKGGTTDVVAEGEGTRFIVFGGGGAPLYDFAATQPWIEKREKTNGFGLLTVSATTMTWVAYRRDGTQIETFTVPK